MAASVKIRFDGDTSALNAKLDRVSKNVGNLGRKFSDSATNVGAMASRLGGMVGASALLFDTWTKITQRIDKARADVVEMARANAQQRASALAVGRNDQERAQINNFALRLLRSGIAPDEGRAFGIAKSAFSSGFGGEGDTISMLELLGQGTEATIDAMADIGGTVKDAPKSFEEMADMIFAAGQRSKKQTAEVAQAVAQAAPIATKVDTSFAELLAIFSELRGDSLERMRTGMRALADKFIELGVEGQGLTSRAETFAARGLTDRAARKQLGAEAFTALQILIDQSEKVRAGQRFFESGGATGGLRASVSGVLRQDPLLIAEIARRAEKAKTQYGVGGAIQGQAVNEAVRQADLERLQREYPIYSSLPLGATILGAGEFVSGRSSGDVVGGVASTTRDRAVDLMIEQNGLLRTLVNRGRPADEVAAGMLDVGEVE